MSAQSKPPLLFIKLPRNVVDKLATLSAEELQLVLGGKERITTGTLRLGSQRFDVRFSSERSSAPPLLFQGAMPQPMGSDKWAEWTERGKLVGKLTVTHRSKPTTLTTTLMPNVHSSDSGASGQSRSQSQAARPVGAPNAMSPKPPGHTRMPSVTRIAPQKKPGILRQNREMLRDQIVHTLACGSEEEPFILERIKGPPNAVLDALASVAQKNGTRWTLLPESFKMVNVESWPKYDAKAKEKVARNALAAFDTLGLNADDPDRRRIALVLQRLNGETLPSASSVADTPLLPGLPSSVKLKSPTVPSIGLPKDTSSPAPAPAPTPTPKKKPSRSIIAPTSVRKSRPEPVKVPQRAGGLPGLAAEAISDSKAKESSLPSSRHVPSLSINEQKKPMQLVEENGNHGSHHQGRPRATTSGSQFISAPNTATNPTDPINLARPEAAEADQRYLSVRRNGNPSRRIREEPDNYAASDAEAEYHRSARPESKSPVTAASQDSTHSRSQSHNPRGIPDASSGTDKEINAAEEEENSYGKRRHVPVRSRPIQTQPLVFPSPAKSPHVPVAAVDTGAAVSRVQERLAQGMLSEKRLPGLSTVAKGAAQSSGNPIAAADTADVSFKRPRGPSLSPIASLPRSRSASPAPRVESAETIEDLEQLQRQIEATYAEYSRLRLKIDSCCGGFSLLSDELNAAVDAFRPAWRAALNEHNTSEADREEGEEIPGDAPQDSALSLSIDVTNEKCTPGGDRLYWTAEPDANGDFWVADSPEAILGMEVGRDGHPCRSRKLLPEETRVLQAIQAVVARYAELDGDDIRRCIRRYMRLHEHLESMVRLMRAAYSCISQGIMAQYDGLRDELGDMQIDKALTAADAVSESKTLSIDAFRDSQIALSGAIPPTKTLL
ncbi:hypothetical protein J3B02_002571 [Coemansia erecta]|nr:hypothetical protein J3B02_002571 [Coemansia erecta]